MEDDIYCGARLAIGFLGFYDIKEHRCPEYFFFA